MPAALTPTPEGFFRHGEPHLIVSGALHYFRVHPGQWRDRLRRLVALGCDTVETYVAWNVHQPSPGETTFEGFADLGRFLDLAAEEGLDAIVRPGPYICAEWENGGFPGWLLADRNLRLRHRDPREQQQRQSPRAGRVLDQTDHHRTERREHVAQALCHG